MSPSRFAERRALGEPGAAPPDAHCGPSRPSLARISAALWPSGRRLLLYAGGSAPGSPLAYVVKGRPVRRSAAVCGRGAVCKRDGSTGRGAASAQPRGLRPPRTRPVQSTRAGPPARGLITPFSSLTETWRLGGRRTLAEHLAYPRPRRDFCRPRAGPPARGLLTTRARSPFPSRP